MRYRGFQIYTYLQPRVEYFNATTNSTELCQGYACYVYVPDYEQTGEFLDYFVLAVGHEVSDTSPEAAHESITRYVDDMYYMLSAKKAQLECARKTNLVDRLVTWIAEGQDEKTVYHTLTETIGMTDEDIREIGYTSLKCYFDQEKYVQSIAEHYIDIGSENTVTGNWYISFQEINDRYDLCLPKDKDVLEELMKQFRENYPSIFQNVVQADNGILLSFLPNICPNVKPELEQDWQHKDAPGMQM